MARRWSNSDSTEGDNIIWAHNMGMNTSVCRSAAGRCQRRRSPLGTPTEGAIGRSMTCCGLAGFVNQSFYLDFRTSFSVPHTGLKQKDPEEEIFMVNNTMYNITH